MVGLPWARTSSSARRFVATSRVTTCFAGGTKKNQFTGTLAALTLF